MYMYLCLNLDTLPFRNIEQLLTFALFDTMYIDSQYSGTRKRLMLGCVDFPRLTSPRLASHLQLQSTMCYNSAEQSRVEQSV